MMVMGLVRSSMEGPKYSLQWASEELILAQLASPAMRKWGPWANAASAVRELTAEKP
jgi:hypothetical protein